jgi:hypothetical protein
MSAAGAVPQIAQMLAGRPSANWLSVGESSDCRRGLCSCYSDTMNRGVIDPGQRLAPETPVIAQGLGE